MDAEPTPTPLVPKSQKKGPAWVDPDEIGGRDYERRLRRKFEKLNPTPQWASDTRKKRSITKRRMSFSPSSVSEENLDFLTSAGGGGYFVGEAEIEDIPPKKENLVIEVPLYGH